MLTQFAFPKISMCMLQSSWFQDIDVHRTNVWRPIPQMQPMLPIARMTFEQKIHYRCGQSIPQPTIRCALLFINTTAEKSDCFPVSFFIPFLLLSSILFQNTVYFLIFSNYLPFDLQPSFQSFTSVCYILTIIYLMWSKTVQEFQTAINNPELGQ